MMKKFGKFSTVVGAVVLGLAGFVGAAPTAEAAGVACPAGQLRSLAGIDYSGLNVKVKCVSQPRLGAMGWATADPFNREIVVYHGPKVSRVNYNSLLSHEAMHIAHFYMTGKNEAALNRSMGYSGLVDWRTQLYSGTPGDAAWKRNTAEGIAEGLPKCLNMPTNPMKYRPVNCKNFKNAVVSSNREVKSGQVVTYAGNRTIKKGKTGTVYGIYLNQRPGKWMYEFRLQGKGQNLLLGRTTETFTKTSAKGGQFGMYYKVPSSAVAGRTYKIVTIRYAVKPNGSRGALSKSYAPSAVSTVKITR